MAKVRWLVMVGIIVLLLLVVDIGIWYLVPWKDLVITTTTTTITNVIMNNSTTTPTNTQSINHHYDSTMTIQDLVGIAKKNITVLVKLRGELGNHLSLFAHARIVQILALQTYNIHIHIIGQHQKDPKWKRSYNDIMKCFPNLRKDVTFFGGIHDKTYRDEFLYIQELQSNWLSTTQQQLLTNPRKEGLQLLQQLISLPIHQLPTSVQTYYYNNATASSKNDLSNAAHNYYSLPYLIIDDFNGVWEEALKKKNPIYYNNIRQWFQFNTSSTECCGIRSSFRDDSIDNLQDNWNNDTAITSSTSSSISTRPDTTTSTTSLYKEVVYHHRNFMFEMKQRAIGNHYTEATPETVVNLMLGGGDDGNNDNNNITNNRKYNRNHTRITILSRYSKGLESYIELIYSRTGITTLYIQNQTGVQDFCYMLTRTYDDELIGKYQSTYVLWAAFLGNTRMNRFYALNQNIIGFNTNTNYTSIHHPIHLLEYIEQSNRSFISEQYWQPAQQ